MTTTRKPTTRTAKPNDTNVTDISYGPKAKVQRAAAQRAATKAAAPPRSGATILDPSRFWDQADAGDTFQHRLTATFPNEEVYVTCKPVEIADVVLDGGFPYEFTTQMMAGLQQVSEHPELLNRLTDAGDSVPDVLAAVSAVPQLKPFVDALFVTAVIEPKAYLDKEEARAEGGLWVGHVRLMDKMTLMAAIQGEDDGLTATFPPAAEPAV